MCLCVCVHTFKKHMWRACPSSIYVHLGTGEKLGMGFVKGLRHLETIAKDQLWISCQVLKMSNYKVTKGSSSGATLSLALRSKGDAGQPSYLIFFRRLLFISGPATPSQTLKSDPKHCNLHCFCDFFHGKNASCNMPKTAQIPVFLLAAVQKTL